MPTTHRRPKQITDGEFDERDIEWAPDGSKIYFMSTRVPEAYYEPSDSDLYSVPATGGAITKVASIDGTISASARVARRQRIAFVGTPARQSRPLLQPAGSVRRRRRARQHAAEPHRGLRLRYRRRHRRRSGARRAADGKPIVWSNDGASLIVVSAEHGSANLKRSTIATGEDRTDHRRAAGRHGVHGDAGRVDRSRPRSRRRPISAICFMTRPLAKPRHRSRTSTTSCSRTFSRASPRRSGTRASTARTFRAGF